MERGERLKASSLKTNRGQIGLEDLFSWLIYAVFFILLVLIIGITQSCSGISEVTRDINSETGDLLRVEAERQLTTYLRTPMPEDMNTNIGRLTQYNYLQKANSKLEETRYVLEEFPELQQGTYGDFITQLYDARELIDAHLRDNDKDATHQDIFNVVTEALFHERKARQAQNGLPQLIVPAISVKFDAVGTFPYTDGDLYVKDLNAKQHREPSQTGYVHLPTETGIITVAFKLPADTGENTYYLPRP